MNALHLLWIVPTAAVVGFCWGAVLAAGKDTPPQDNVERCLCVHCPYKPQHDEII